MFSCSCPAAAADNSPPHVALQVLELDSIPSVVTLIGGGYIGMEFAGMFARLGCEVHVVARQELPLAPRFDKEVRHWRNPCRANTSYACGTGDDFRPAAPGLACM